MFLAFTAATALLLLKPAPTQDGSLMLRLSLESERVWVSEFQGLVYVAEFKNTLDEPLRWHPRSTLFSPLVDHTALCMLRTDGKPYVQYQPKGFGYDGEVTNVLQPGASEFLSWELWRVVEADQNWLPEEDPETQQYSYQGTPPLGTYDVWVRYTDGPSANGPFVERMPGEGIYQSNTVRLTVVPDGTPDVPRPALLEQVGGPRSALNRVIPHPGARLVWVKGLEKFGVRCVEKGSSSELLLERGERRLRLPVSAPMIRTGKSSPVAIAALVARVSKSDYLVW